jgi:hypothetical protein
MQGFQDHLGEDDEICVYWIDGCLFSRIQKRTVDLWHIDLHEL